MTRHVSIGEFTSSPAEVLSRLRETGEEVVIVDSGRPVADLSVHRTAKVPSPEERDRLLADLRASTRILGDIMSPVVDEADWELD